MSRTMFDRAKVSRLRTAYQQARDQNQPSFVFDGTVLITEYARYLLEILLEIEAAYGDASLDED
jgi:hypothetical protein